MLKKIFALILWGMIVLLPTHGFSHFPRLIPTETPEKGVGDWEKVPFGQMRVLSCTTGVQNLGLVVGGVEVHLNAGWTLKKPTLHPLSDAFPAWIETPVRPGTGRDTLYQREVFFPFIYTRNPSDTSDFEAGFQGVFPACQGDVCMDLPLRIGLKLGSDEADYTNYCAYIMDQQKQVPIPPQGHAVKGFARKLNDALELTFVGLRDPNIAFLQTPDQDDFQIQETQLEKTGLYMRMKTKPWPQGTTKEWILITNKGIFRVPVLMQSAPVLLPADSIPLHIWWMGWELFFLTPLFIWWGVGIAKTKKLWQKQIVRLMYTLPLIFLLWIGRQYLGLNALLGAKVSAYYALCLWGIICLFPPQKGWIALGLFFIWPSVIQLPDLSMGLFFIWGLVMLIEIELPFVLLYFKADEIGKVLRDYKKRRFFVFNLTFLVPTVALLLMGIYRLDETKIIYQNQLNHAGISAVCQKCKSWQETGAYLIDPKSILGKSLQDVYRRSGDFLIWQEGDERVILSPGISNKRVDRFINNWQKYRASGMP